MKRKSITNAVLMALTIGAIISFQAYWLKDTYDREKKALLIKTNFAFQETLHQLQAIKLKLPDLFAGDTAQGGRTRILMDENIREEGKSGSSMPPMRIIAMVNSVRDKMHDPAVTDSISASTIILQAKGNLIRKSNMPVSSKRFTDSSNHILNVLYRVDSLQDSIKVAEVAARFAKALQKEKLGVPFNITRTPGARAGAEDDMGKAVIGLAHPVTYRLFLLDTNDYLLKKILVPIMFSLFLVGVTILSFVLLYRNLLRQQRLTEMKNDFIANISHELKTPIATVGVALEALRNFNAIQDARKTEEYLDISSKELQRLSMLVDKVLRLSMFEKQRIRLSKEPFDFKALTAQVLAAMKPQFEKQQAVVNFTSEGDDFMIKADILHLTSVLYNLLDNALKYGKDKPLIDVTLSREKDIFTLGVRDNGIGIAKEYRRKIFDKFFRVPTGNQHAVKGYGLGLSYVSEIIRQHIGYIYVESELGKGSTFIAKIPVEEADVIWFDEKRSIRRKQFFISAKA